MHLLHFESIITQCGFGDVLLHVEAWFYYIITQREIRCIFNIESVPWGTWMRFMIWFGMFGRETGPSVQQKEHALIKLTNILF